MVGDAAGGQARPGGGGQPAAPARLIPQRIAMEMALTGNMMRAERLHAYGLINELTTRAARWPQPRRWPGVSWPTRPYCSPPASG